MGKSNHKKTKRMHTSVCKNYSNTFNKQTKQTRKQTDRKTHKLSTKHWNHLLTLHLKHC